MTRYRVVVFCKDRFEGTSKWRTTAAEAFAWALIEDKEWTCPQGKHFILESELKRPRYTVCPHCGNGMEHAHGLANYDYNCYGGCGRAWRIKDAFWHALFSAGEEIYSRIDVRNRQRHKKILEWRTDK